MRSTRFAAALLLACASCDADSSPIGPPLSAPSPQASLALADTDVPDPPLSAPPALPSAPEASVSPPEIEAAPSSAAAARSAQTPEAPAWPEGTTEILVSWIIHPVVGDVVNRRHVDVDFSAGGVHRTVPFDARWSDWFDMYQQSHCNEALRDRGSRRTVASLFLAGTMYDELVVERPSTERLELFSLVAPEGVCTDAKGNDVACPADRRLLASVLIPEGARVKERFLRVARTDTAAGPGTGPPREVLLHCGGD